MTNRRLSVLLDLDGTLVDSAPGILASCEATLRALGHEPRNLDIASVIGPPLEEVLAPVLGRFGDDRVDEAVRLYREHYGATGLLETEIYPGVEAALDELTALGAALYVATSKRTVFANRILEHLGLASRFAATHGSEPGGALDHKPELIAHVLGAHDLSPNGCVMVGDRRHDVIGAIANAVAPIGVLWGYGDRSELETAGARRIAERPADLVAILASGAS